MEAFAASAMAERTAMMNRLVENGYISQTVADDVEGHVQEIVEAMHAMLTDAPSLLLQAALVDGVGEPAPNDSRALPESIRTGACRWRTAQATWYIPTRSSTCHACSP